MFYDPWLNGNLPEGYFFQEFDEEDARQCSGDAYVKNLKDLPDEEYKRFVKNRWDYSDVPNQLIKYEWYRQCIADEPVILPTMRGLGATDPAWEGDDHTNVGRMHGNHMGWWEDYPKQDPDISGIMAVQRAQEYGIEEGDWIVDPIGVGAATALKMRNDLEFKPDLFIAGAEPVNIFGMLRMFNKRSEAGWILRECMKNTEITFTHHPEFQRQCMAVKYSLDEKKFRIRPKEEMKKELGISPGYFDVAMMLIHKFKTTTGDLAELLCNQQLEQREEPVMTRAVRERLQIMRQNRMAS